MHRSHYQEVQMSQYLQCSGVNNAFASVSGYPAAGVGVVAWAFNGAPAQRWDVQEYPGRAPGDDAGKVYALFLADTKLAITAGDCATGVTLQPFTQDLSQFWTYSGTPGSMMRNVGNGCVLDLGNGDADGGVIQSYQAVGSPNQQWTLQAQIGASAPLEADELVGAAVPA
jgi:hypothetical protein